MVIVCIRNDRDPKGDNYNRERNFNRGDRPNRDQFNRGPPQPRDEGDNRPPRRIDDTDENIENRMPKFKGDEKPVRNSCTFSGTFELQIGNSFE